MLRFFNENEEDITDELSATGRCGNPSCLGEPWCSAWGICASYQPQHREIEGSGMEQEEYLDHLMLELSQTSTPMVSFLLAS